MRFKILVVDDDRHNREALKLLLEKEDFSVILAQSGGEAQLAAIDSKPDVILMDVALPDTDGIALCRRFKSDRRTAFIPVLLMSGQYKEVEKQVEGMEEGGADDYLVKPFSSLLLVAKMRTVLRRYSAPEELKELLKTEGLELDVQARTVSLKERRVPLTRKEFDLLTTFLRKKDKVLSVPYLLETVWGYNPADYNDPSTIQVHLSSLRRKLGPKLGKKIVSVPGLGYRFE